MATKHFVVSDVLPATTQLRISWVGDITEILGGSYIKSQNDSFALVGRLSGYLDIYITKDVYGNRITIWDDGDYVFPDPYTNYDGDHPYCDIDTSTWDINKRTISSVSSGMDVFRWEDLNASSGYTITFNSNGGTTISDIEEATELPTPLPTPTKSGYTFLGWYYDSSFTNAAVAGDPLTSDVTLYAKWELNTYTITYNSNGGTSVSQATGVTTLPSTLPTTTREGYTFVAWYIDSALTTRAVAGATIEANTTLYAKWHNLGSLFTEIADAIRSKDGTSENIRDVDFGERVKQIQGAIELTQAQYDALETKDANTYYLIVEVE